MPATTATPKAVNYTPEQTAVLVSRYVDDNMSVADLAKMFGKTTRSIVAKLSREKVYEKKEYTTKKGEKPVSKDGLADVMGKYFNLTEAEASSLTGANKTALVKIMARVVELTPVPTMVPTVVITGEFD